MGFCCYDSLKNWVHEEEHVICYAAAACVQINGKMSLCIQRMNMITWWLLFVFFVWVPISHNCSKLELICWDVDLYYAMLRYALHVPGLKIF